MEQSELEATAYHEAGRAVIALHLGSGLQGRGLRIVQDDESAYHEPLEREHFGFPQRAPSDPMRKRIEVRVMIALAGLAAQLRFESSSVSPVHSEQTRRAALILLASVSSSEEEQKAYMRWLDIRVQDMLVLPNLWRQVEAVASALIERKSLTPREVRRVSLAHDG